MEIRVTRDGRKHRIGNAHILAAMIDAGEPEVEEGSDALVYIGTDDRGVELYIIAVPDNRRPGGLAVIHCTPNEWRNRRKS